MLIKGSKLDMLGCLEQSLNFSFSPNLPHSSGKPQSLPDLCDILTIAVGGAGRAGPLFVAQSSGYGAGEVLRSGWTWWSEAQRWRGAWPMSPTPRTGAQDSSPSSQALSATARMFRHWCCLSELPCSVQAVLAAGVGRAPRGALHKV